MQLAAFNVYHAHRMYANKTVSAADWSIANPEAWDIITRVETEYRNG